MRRIATLALLLLTTLSVAPARGAAEALPAAEEVHKSFDDGKYNDVLKSIARITSSRDWQGKKYDHFDLLSLKAETHVKLKEAYLAASTFEQAAKDAPDRKSAALARASQVLFKRATNMKFVPKPPPGEHKSTIGPKEEPTPGIDVADPESRKLALAALYHEAKAAEEPRVKFAETGKSVDAILEAAPSLARLRDLELAASGADDETAQRTEALTNRSRDLLTEMTDKMGPRVDVISGRDLDYEKVRVGGNDMWRRHGLEGRDEPELRELSAKSEKILTAVRLLTAALAPEKDFFDRVTKEAKRIRNRADKTISADYGEVSYTRPKKDW